MHFAVIRKCSFLDEPTSGLDPKQIVDIRRAIKGLKNNHTVFLSSHIISDIEDVCDRIIIINKGKVVYEGTEEEILDMFSNKDVVVMTLAKSGLEKLKAKLLKLAYIERCEYN